MNLTIHPRSEYLAHPVAARFPMLSGDDMKEIVASMTATGFDEEQPIILFNNQVLDGRNRLFAALEAEIKPVYRQFNPAIDGNSLIELVIRRNIKRRHLSPSVRAALAAEMIPLLNEELKNPPASSAPAAAPANVVEFPQAGDAPPPVTVEAPTFGDDNSVAAKAAKMFGAGKTNTKLAKALQEKAPDLFTKVLEGEMTVNAAKKEFEAREAARRAEQGGAKEQLERNAALTAISETYGAEHEFTKAAHKKRVLKKHDELLSFSGLPKAEGLKVIPLMLQKWSLSKAQKYLAAELTADMTLQDFIAAGIARGKGSISFTVEGWKITAVSPEAKKQAKAAKKSDPAAESTPAEPVPPAEETPAESAPETSAEVKVNVDPEPAPSAEETPAAAE
jgi:hypothetical protein